MKRNIDLTEHGFGVRNSTANFISVASFPRTKKHIPWSSGTSYSIIQDEKEFLSSTLFKTGYVYQIKLQNKYGNFGEGIFCDRCGKQLKMNLFGKTLCKKCLNDLFDNIKIPWKKIGKTKVEPKDELARYLNTRTSTLSR